MHRYTAYLLTTTALLSVPTAPALGNPLDPRVVAGQAQVEGLGSHTVTVKQSSDKAIIDWRSFDIGPNEATVFDQPNSTSLTLNRVTGGEGASEILGALKADGQIFLVNRDGILIGKDAVIDVGALIATTHDLLDRDFMAGDYRFDKSGNPEASIVNLGTITVEDGGYAALVAPGVRNAGTIRARLGNISLASADSFTLDLYGDQLIQLAVDDATAGTVIDLETGQALKDLVSNSGLLAADGGTVELSASAARSVINSVINNTGVIEADSIGTRNGKIVLSAATVHVKPTGAPAQNIKVSGTLSATGEQRGEIGGKVVMTGEIIELTLATIDAFGWDGGGAVLVGGDIGGGRGHGLVAAGRVRQEAAAIPNASVTTMADSSSIDASALEDGDGGKIIVWSDYFTSVEGKLTARGGPKAGDGGFIETSGKVLRVSTPGDASGPAGRAGMWLLDPLNITIADTSSTGLTAVPGSFTSHLNSSLWSAQYAYALAEGATIGAADLATALNAGTNVYVDADVAPGTEAGHINVLADIRKTAGPDAILFLDAAGDISIAAGVEIASTSGRLSLELNAATGGITAPNVRIDTNGGYLHLDARDDIVLHSESDMPTLVSVGANWWPTSHNTRHEFDLIFDQDRVYFYHENGIAQMPTDGIRLVDSSSGERTLFIQTMGLNFELHDRSTTLTDDGAHFRLSMDSDANYGVHESAFLNGIPEIVSSPDVWTFSLGSEPPNGIVPVIEIGRRASERYAPTSPKGQQLVANFAASMRWEPPSVLPSATNNSGLVAKQVAAKRQLEREERRLEDVIDDAKDAIRDARSASQRLINQATNRINRASRLALGAERTLLLNEAQRYLEQADELTESIAELEEALEGYDVDLADVQTELRFIDLDTGSLQIADSEPQIMPSPPMIPVPSSDMPNAPLSPGFAALVERVLMSYDSVADIQSIASNAIFAALAQYAYENGAGAPDGWTVIGGQESINGMGGVVFENDATGEIVLAFRGTTRWDIEWPTNSALWAGLPVDQIPEMQDALSYARSVKHQFERVTFVGHSLGGAMAQYAAVELRESAVTFDAAPLEASLSAARGNLLYSPQLPEYRNVINFKGPADPVTGALVTGTANMSGLREIGGDPIEVRSADAISLLGAAFAELDLPPVLRGKAKFGGLFEGALKYNHDDNSLAREMAAIALVYEYLRTIP